MKNDQPKELLNEEIKKLLQDEVKSRPAIAYSGMLCFGCLLGGFILNIFFQDGLPLTTRYFAITIIHLLGLLSGLVSINLTSEAMKQIRKKNLTLPMALNGMFLLIFGYRSLVLLQLL
ncbi:MAG: hypothetical protein OEV42_21185 [Deltaproteobacteria bacterium]|nr:hypothetical protein [Deltaproteobacteria bacterium]